MLQNEHGSPFVAEVNSAIAIAPSEMPNGQHLQEGTLETEY